MEPLVEKNAVKFHDRDDNVYLTDKPHEIKFIRAMNRAKIPWSIYSGRGMFGRSCPAVYTDREISDEDVVFAARKAGISGLCRDNMGFNWVLYTG